MRRHRDPVAFAAAIVIVRFRAFMAADVVSIERSRRRTVERGAGFASPRRTSASRTYVTVFPHRVYVRS